jgi:predicted nucleic acid-binding protein
LIATDTSSFARMLDGETDAASVALRVALDGNDVHLPPVVQMEILSNPNIAESAVSFVMTIPLLAISDGYWVRAAILRADLKRRVLKASIADCLIAQSCIDHDIPLITYDRDFRHFVRAGLKLL